MATHSHHDAAEAEGASHIEDLGPSLFRKLSERANSQLKVKV